MPTLRSLLLLALALCTWADTTTGQVPGETPQLRLTDGLDNTEPPGAGPWNNSHSFEAPAGLVFQAQLNYLATVPPNDAVPWGLFVSLQQTNLPTGQFPPPLFTQPPFLFVGPYPPLLDVAGAGSHTFVIPPGLYDGTLYVQAVVLDGSAGPGASLKLSNGLRVDVVPPPFHVSFGFAREVPALTESTFIEGVGSRDFDGDTLNTFRPFGNVDPPASDVDAGSGLPALMEFLPIAPNQPDAPSSALGRPVTKVSVAVGPTPNEIFVQDTSHFPSEGTLLIGFNQKVPWANKTGGGKTPAAEVAYYRGKTTTSFKNVSRKRVGSAGSSTYQHLVGEFVVGDYSLTTTPAALSRGRVSLDARNQKLPHIVLPDTDSGEQLDLYRYRDTDSLMEGFAVYDRVNLSWRVLPDTQLDASSGDTAWDGMLTISPDGLWFLAIQRVNTGGFFPFDADKLWAIRLDGQTWPASGKASWELPFETDPDPDPVMNDTTFARSRRISAPSIAIAGSGPHDWVAYVGLSNKWEQSATGSGSEVLNGVRVGIEAAYVRDSLLVRDYIEVPIITPGSGHALWVGPRPRISDDFPDVGAGDPLQHFDPLPLVTPDHSRIVLAGGFTEDDEDLYVLRSISIDDTTGEPLRTLQNLTGHGASSAAAAGRTRIREFELGGAGLGPKAAFSPSGDWIAYVVKDKSASSDFRDWLQIARTNGSSFATTAPLWANDEDDFRYGGPLEKDRQINSVYWLDEDRVVFVMGVGYYGDPFGMLVASHAPACDVFLYNRLTDELVNLTNTGGGLTDFDTLGTIVPAGSFRSADGRYVFYLRDGEISQGTTVMPPGTQVMNILAVDAVTEFAFDVSGDELGALSPLRNIDIPETDAFTPVEAVAALSMIEGAGIQGGTYWFTALEANSAADADELFFFDGGAPFLGLQLTEFSPLGSRISSVVPDPFATRAAFAQTADSDPAGNTQHPFVVDYTSFLTKRDLVPTMVVDGEPIGRVMDGSFHFIPPGNGVTDALVFSMGDTSDPLTGLARNTLPVYLSLANLTEVLLEPIPLLIALIDNDDIGSNYRFYILSAGPSAAP
ncbi:MAG: hypothetical protein DRQ55_01165 [Planctomycetota bacterium]|nr:MAG: hypothetical protein DRQ55_01165 [Planctomycetota bacterium]